MEGSQIVSMVDRKKKFGPKSLTGNISECVFCRQNFI
jgi:hypothetical protein